jgi:hypothetical protein
MSAQCSAEQVPITQDPLGSLIGRAPAADRIIMHPQANRQAVGTVERRRRVRMHSATEGWVIPDLAGPDAEPWEVRVSDISRNGVGFESTQKMDEGEICRIRIGRGPMRLARRIRIVNCRAGALGHYLIGGEFMPPSGAN